MSNVKSSISSLLFPFDFFNSCSAIFELLLCAIDKNDNQIDNIDNNIEIHACFVLKKQQ